MPPGGFPCLEVLNLSYNGLDSDAILTLADLPRLRQLDVSRNELTALPADMSGFHSLQVLNCDHNMLGTESCWYSLCLLPSLLSLSLSKNRVEYIPERAADGFGALQSLNLTHNQICREEALLPTLRLANLRTLLLYGNPFLMHGGASSDLTEVMSQVRAGPWPFGRGESSVQHSLRARRPPD